MLCNSVGMVTCMEELYVPLGGFCGVIGGFEPLLASPSLLHLVYLDIQEACLLGHFPEHWSEVIWPFLFKHGFMHLVVGLHWADFYYLWVLGEGFSSGFPEGSSQRFPLLVGGLLRQVTGSLLFLPQVGHALVRWRMVHCLMPVWGAGVSDVRGTETWTPCQPWPVAGIQLASLRRGLRKCHLSEVAGDTPVPHGIWKDKPTMLCHRPPWMLGIHALPPLALHMLQLKHTFLILSLLFQSVSLGGMMGFCNSLIMAPHNESSASLMVATHVRRLHIFDGLGGLGFISACAWKCWHVPCQLSLAGVQGGLGHEQLLQGCVHLSLQSKHLIGQASWIGPGGLKTVDWGRCWLHPEFLIW